MERHAGGSRSIPTVAPAPSETGGRGSAQATHKVAKHHKNIVKHFFEKNWWRRLWFQVVQVWLLSSKCGCVRHSGDCREGRRASWGRARDIDAPREIQQEVPRGDPARDSAGDQATNVPRTSRYSTVETSQSGTTRALHGEEVEET